jgi:ribonucleoside-diphosphate reductase alpha chain
MSFTVLPNAKKILEKRYLQKDARGKITETPEEMITRVADAVARADEIYGSKEDAAKTSAKFRRLLERKWFLPNSPTLMNAGNRLGQLAACFVLPIEDSMESIFQTLGYSALIHKSGGGTGFSFSRIRPAKDVVSSTAGVSSGPLSFMNVFDVATETVKQGGTRRGANMGVLKVDHPDIEAFIATKNDLCQLNNFNVSVGLTRQFMKALDSGGLYDLINPRNGKTVNCISAQKVFDCIVDAAWQTGEPGILFLDRVNQDNPTPQLGDIEATNPCGEQPLLPFESCTLGSINLLKMVHHGQLNFDRLKKTVWDAVHFLDNVIDVNNYPLAEIEQISKANRKIGLGVMGFADMLIALGIAYDSEDALQQADQTMSFIQKEAHLASAGLARKRGNFPNFSQSIYDQAGAEYMRNATTTTIAPTGTISLIAGTSSGIEPLFAVAHRRRVLDGQMLNEIHPLFVKMAKAEGCYSKQLLDEVAQKGSVTQIESLPDTIRKIFRTSQEISAEWHIKIQAAFQRHVDNAVSKTINFGAGASPDDVRQAFLMAYRSGCKGLTIYRYGSRDKQVLSVGVGSDADDMKGILPRSRPVRTHGVTERIRTGCGKLYVTINSDDVGICEVFAKMGKTGGCASSQIEASGRLISLALRSGVKVEAIAKQLIGIRCPTPSWENGKMVLSCPDAMAQVLKNISEVDIEFNEDFQGANCPECGNMMCHAEGCLICRSCGYSRC